MNFAENSIHHHHQEEITLSFSHNNGNDITNNDLQDSVIAGLHQNTGNNNNKQLVNQIQNPNQQLLNNINNQSPPQNDFSILNDTILNASDQNNNNESQLNASQLLQNNTIPELDSTVRDTMYSILKSHTVGFFFFILMVLYIKFNITYYYPIIFLWLVDIYSIVANLTALSESTGG